MLWLVCSVARGASKLPVTCSVLGACSPRWSPGCALREQHPDLDAGAEQVGEALRTLEAEEAKVNAEAHALLGVGIPVLSPRFTASRYANLHWSQTQRGRAWRSIEHAGFRCGNLGDSSYPKPKQPQSLGTLMFCQILSLDRSF